jgi:hypothetical protein
VFGCRRTCVGPSLVTADIPDEFFHCWIILDPEKELGAIAFPQAIIDSNGLSLMSCDLVPRV